MSMQSITMGRLGGTGGGIGVLLHPLLFMLHSKYKANCSAGTAALIFRQSWWGSLDFTALHYQINSCNLFIPYMLTTLDLPQIKLGFLLQLSYYLFLVMFLFSIPTPACPEKMCCYLGPVLGSFVPGRFKPITKQKQGKEIHG